MRSDMVKKGTRRRRTGVSSVRWAEGRRLRQAVHRRGQLVRRDIPGHVHLQEVGRIVGGDLGGGGVPFEFNTIGVDDGIAMGHTGMRYSLPSRELIADAVESMALAHCSTAW